MTNVTNKLLHDTPFLFFSTLCLSCDGRNDKTVLFQESVRLSMGHGGIDNIGETTTAGEWGSNCQSVGMQSPFDELPDETILNVSEW